MNNPKSKQLLEKFNVGTWMKVARLREGFRLLLAINAYKTDDTSIQLLKNENRLKAAQIFDEDPILETEHLEDIYSYFACNGYGIDNLEDLTEYLEYCFFKFFDFYLNDETKNEEDTKSKIVSSLLEEQANSTYWSNFINLQYVASRVYFDAFLVRISEDSAFEITDSSESLSAREIATLFYYLNISKEYTNETVAPEKKEWQYCIQNFGKASIDNIRKFYNIIAHQEQKRIASPQAYKKIQKIITYLEQNHPHLEKTISLAKLELEKADKLR